MTNILPNFQVSGASGLPNETLSPPGAPALPTIARGAPLGGPLEGFWPLGGPFEVEGPLGGPLEGRGALGGPLERGALCWGAPVLLGFGVCVFVFAATLRICAAA